MKRALSLVTAISLGSCSFATHHQAVTIGAATGSVAFVMCGIEVEELGTCTAVGGIAGLAIGGITGLVMLLTNTHEGVAYTDDELPAEQVRRRRHVEEPPGPYEPPEAPAAPPILDAGVPDAPPADAAPQD